MHRISITIVSLILITGCGNDDRNPNNVIVTDNNPNPTPTNNGTTSTNNGTTTATNNGTTATNNGTTSTNNGTTSTNNGTTTGNNAMMGELTLSGSVVAGEMPPQLPISCAVRLYDPNDVNPADPDLFTAPLQQDTFTLSEFPMPWVFEGLNRNERYYVGILCDRDADLEFDNIGGWHADSNGTPTSVVVPADALEIAVGTFRL